MSYFILENVPESAYTGESFTYKIGTKSSNYISKYYNLRYTFSSGSGATAGTIATRLTDTKYKWTPDTEVFARVMPNNDRGKLTILIDSYDSSNVISHTETKSFTLILNSSVSPQITDVTINKELDFNGKSISGITRHYIQMNVKGLYNATQHVYINVNGQNIQSRDIQSAGNNTIHWSDLIGVLNYESDDINSSNSIEIKITSRDSRGRSTSVSQNVTVYPYSPPTINASLSWNDAEKPVLNFSYDYQKQVAKESNELDTLKIVYPYNNLVHTYDLKDKSSPCVLDEDLDIAKSHTFYINIKDKVLTNAVQQKVILPSMNLVMDIGADGKTVTFFGTSPSSADETTLRIGDYASFGKRVRIGNEQNRYTLVDENGLQILNGAEKIAHIGYGDCLALPEDADGNIGTDYIIMERPYYTFGTRSDNEESPTVQSSDSEVSTQDISSTIGEYSVALGQNVKASGANSQASGIDTIASGYASSAFGQKTVASGSQSHAEGYGTKAVGNGQTVVGRYNDPDYNHMFTVGIGLGEDVDDVKNRANGFYVDTSGNTKSYGETHSGGNIVADTNGKGIWLQRNNGVSSEAMVIDGNNTLSIGYGQWENNNNTILRGNDIYLYSKVAGGGTRPYYRKGDTISGGFLGAGYAHNEYTVVFYISLAAPILGNPTITATSGSGGAIIRQLDKFLYGSTISKGVNPSSISVYKEMTEGCGLTIRLNMPNKGDIPYPNSPVGVTVSLNIVFS